MRTPRESENIEAIVILIFVVLAIFLICVFFYIIGRKGKFKETPNATLIKSSIQSARIGYIYTTIFRKRGAIMTDKNIILLNKNTVKYYTLIDKRGLGKIQSALLHVSAGHLVGCAADTMLGHKRWLLFVKLNNNDVLLLRTTGYYYDDYIYGKCIKRKATESDYKQIEKLVGHSVDLLKI